MVIIVSLLASCSFTSETTVEVNVVSSASIVDNGIAFEKVISTDGTWIIATVKDLTIENEPVLDGGFKNGRADAEGNDLLQRKIALYPQDADRNIIDRFTLTVKKADHKPF